MEGTTAQMHISPVPGLSLMREEPFPNVGLCVGCVGTCVCAGAPVCMHVEMV